MKYVYVILGTLFLALGILGIFLPLLPTTPFLLLTAGFYLKSSERLYGWLLSNRYLGPYITNYREKRAVTATTKIISLALLWISISVCIIWVVDVLWARIVLGTVLIGVTGHILSFRTMKRSEIVRLVRVKSAADVKALASMADEIWHEYFGSIISAEQIDYMVDKFQSAEAITTQIADEGYEYYFINSGGENAGYFGLRPADGKLMLSKIYIRASDRGKGLAREAFTFMENVCRCRRLSSIWLTVNRHNTDSINIYKKRGFTVVREQVADIGGGFVMDDYIMEKTLA